MSKTKHPSIFVYDGTVAVGRIVDGGRRRVKAYRLVGKGERSLGTYQSRQAAVRAIAAEKATP
jgi:hypothetical protein